MLMTQSEIMDYLDRRTGTYFSAKQIISRFNINKFSVYHALAKIVKREGYEARVINTNKPYGSITLYRAIKEVKNGRKKGRKQE